MSESKYSSGRIKNGISILFFILGNNSYPKEHLQHFFIVLLFRFFVLKTVIFESVIIIIIL